MVQRPIQVCLISKPAGDDLRHQKAELRIFSQPFHPLTDFRDNEGSFADPSSQYDQFRVKCNKKVLPEYFVYYFHTPIGQHKLLSNASQVGVPALARPSSTFQKIEIEIPDLETQKKVVKLIGSL